MSSGAPRRAGSRSSPTRSPRRAWATARTGSVMSRSRCVTESRAGRRRSGRQLARSDRRRQAAAHLGVPLEDAVGAATTVPAAIATSGTRQPQAGRRRRHRRARRRTRDPHRPRRWAEPGGGLTSPPTSRPFVRRGASRGTRPGASANEIRKKRTHHAAEDLDGVDLADPAGGKVRSRSTCDLDVVRSSIRRSPARGGVLDDVDEQPDERRQETAQRLRARSRSCARRPSRSRGPTPPRAARAGSTARRRASLRPPARCPRA